MKCSDSVGRCELVWKFELSKNKFALNILSLKYHLKVPFFLSTKAHGPQLSLLGSDLGLTQ